MHRLFYLFAAFVNVLIAVMTLTEAWLLFQVGSRIAYVDFYPNWILGTFLFTIVEGGIALKYFHTKHYTVAFWGALAYYGTIVLFLFVNYGVMRLAFGTALFMPVYVLMYFFQVAYNGTLALSESKERTWLRIKGIYGAMPALITFALVCIVISGKFIELHSAFSLSQGLFVLANVPAFLMMAANFNQEAKTAPSKPAPVFELSMFISTIAALYFIMSFSIEGYQTKKILPSLDEAVKKVAEPFEARSYVSADGDTLLYRLLMPLDYNPSESYPLVVCLHGSSGTGNDNYRQVAAALMPEFLAHESNREKYKAFVFVPQCKFGTSWGGTHPLPGIDKLVFEAMASLGQELPIDTTRRYVTGISLGGYGTWNFIESHPEYFAAAMPICGQGNPELASKCVNVPVWAFHGAHDERVPVSGSRNMIDALKKQGGNPKYTEFPDAGHDIGKRVCETPGLVDWLFAQKIN